MSQPYPVPIPLPQPKSRPPPDSRGIPDTLNLFFFGKHIKDVSYCNPIGPDESRIICDIDWMAYAQYNHYASVEFLTNKKSFLCFLL